MGQDTQELLNTAYKSARIWWDKHGRKKPIEDYYSAANEATAWALSHYNPHLNPKLTSYIQTICNYRLREVPGRKFRSRDLMVRNSRVTLPGNTFRLSVLEHQLWLDSIQRKLDLQKAVSRLTSRQQFVFTALLGGLLPKDIADMLGIDRRRISEIKSDIVEEIRNFMGG